MDRSKFLFISNQMSDKAAFKASGTINVPNTESSYTAQVIVPNTSGYSLNPSISYSADGINWYTNGNGPIGYTDYHRDYRKAFWGNAYISGNNIILRFETTRHMGARNIRYRLVGTYNG